MQNTANIYETVQGLTPYSTPHNLSYQTTSTGDMGYLYPHFYLPCLPGDKIELDAQIVMRLQPHMAPLMHEIETKVTWFFVPNRLLWRGEKRWNAWETWITGAVEGTEISKWNEDYPNEKITPPDINEIKWNPWERYAKNGLPDHNDKQVAFGADIGTVWEAMGLPHTNQIKEMPTYTNMPIDLPKRAYNQIYNDWYRDQNLQRPVDLKCDKLHKINWARDRFTSAGYEQQKGTAPAIGNIGGTINIIPKSTNPILGGFQAINGTAVDAFISSRQSAGAFGNLTGLSNHLGQVQITGTTSPTDIAKTLEGEQPSGGAFNVSDLRLLIAIQKAMEIDMRTGSRYFEFIKTNFNSTPRNDALQRAEYIGQTKTPVMMGEVLQTSATETNSALGEMAGHGMAIDKGGKNKKYYCQEHGQLIGIITTVPRPQYQQGLPADLLINSKYDIYRPQFAYLSEEPIYASELYYTGDDKKDLEIWGYNGRWDHLRIRHHKVTGLMRADVEQNLSFWNLARYFENRPNLASDFITCTPRKDWLVVPSQPALLYTIGWTCHTMRKIPATSEPGMLDHVYGEGNGGNTVPRLGNSLR